MQKVKQFCYTKDISEVPGKVKTIFKKGSARDIENFISAVWIDKKEASFLIVTGSAFFDNSAGKFDEVLMSTINDVKNVLSLEILNDNGVKFVPFRSDPLPEQLRANLFTDIKGSVPKKSKMLG